MKLFLNFYLVFHFLIIVTCEIKKRGIYRPYSYSSLRFGNELSGTSSNWKLFHDWSGYLRDYNYHISNKELYNLPFAFKNLELQDPGFFVNHLNPPWQFLNLADGYGHNINYASNNYGLSSHLSFKPIFSPLVILKTPSVISIPKARFPSAPADVTENPLPLLSLHSRNSQPVLQDNPKFTQPTPPKNIPATATHPQSGAGRLGSGSLGYVRLQNGRVALGSGSLGYTPAAQLVKNNVETNTPSPNFSNFFIPNSPDFLYHNQNFYNQN